MNGATVRVLVYFRGPPEVKDQEVEAELTDLEYQNMGFGTTFTWDDDARDWINSGSACSKLACICLVQHGSFS